MYACRIKHLLGIGNTQKACALLIGLCAHARHLFQIRALFERAVLLAVSNDVLCGCRIDARNIGKQRMRCGVDIDTDGVDAILNDTAECLIEPRLLHIMLILSDTDGFGVDLDKLC